MFRWSTNNPKKHYQIGSKYFNIFIKMRVNGGNLRDKKGRFFFICFAFAFPLSLRFKHGHKALKLL